MDLDAGSMEMIDRKFLAVVIVVLAVVGIGGAATILGTPLLEQVPPPDELPGTQTMAVTSGDVVIWAEAEYWQDFMPPVDPDPPFYVLISVNITNNGNTSIEDLRAPRATIYFNGTFTPLVTLELVQTIETLVPIVINPGQSFVITYMNDRSSIFSPTIEAGTGLYSRILFIWGDGNEAILTTVPAGLSYTY